MDSSQPSFNAEDLSSVKVEPHWQFEGEIHVEGQRSSRLSAGDSAVGSQYFPSSRLVNAPGAISCRQRATQLQLSPLLDGRKLLEGLYVTTSGEHCETLLCSTHQRSCTMHIQ